jgi:hypothetical protein
MGELGKGLIKGLQEAVIAEQEKKIESLTRELEEWPKRYDDSVQFLQKQNSKYLEKLTIATEALQECRDASKVDGPTIDKMIIRNITGTALTKIKAAE